MHKVAHKVAKADHEILDVLANRFSPRSFQDKAVEREKLMSVLEAARWSPSAFNEQPWRFVIGDKQESPENHQRIFDCINEWNQAWAHSAPVLMIVCGSEFLARNGKPNPTYSYVWMPGNLTGSSVSVSPGATTNYTVVGTDITGCAANSAVDVEVHPATVTVAATPTNLCVSGSTVINATPAAGYASSGTQWQSSPNGTFYTDIIGAT